ncbi:MAG TPA: VacJ family lipoprotein [Micropepsaceae bacterium]|nr:VacJ family lipoprotein [Micropepsaceae bacterium]
MKIQNLVLSVCAASALFLAGCASMPAGENDPYESTNRAIFEFNRQVDDNFALPVARFYRDVVPDPARTGIHNFLTNLDSPVTFGNDLLQGDFRRGGQTFARFITNSTIGLGGLIDMASRFQIPDHTEDFGQTLGVYGSGEGPYIVVPFLGPAPPRDLFGRIVDIFLDPFTYVGLRSKTEWMIGRGGFEVLDLRERNIDTIDQIQRTSIDYYATVRNLYRQSRDAEIRNNTQTPENLPDF